MINRNQANYTKQNGKTNTRISQAPGGTSSISLGWGNQPSNAYDRVYVKKAQQKQQNLYNNINQANGNRQNVINQDLRVMGNDGYHNLNQPIVSNQYQKYRQHNPIQNSAKNLIGGEYGYNKYSEKNVTNEKSHQNTQDNDKNNYQKKSQPISVYKPSTSKSSKHQIQNDELDNALYAQRSKLDSTRMSRNQHKGNQQSQSKVEGRSCIKIREPAQQNNIFGGNYDYWKQDQGNGQTNNNRQKQQNNYPPIYPPKQYSLHQNQQKTSVKVHNPPGGKSNFIFG